MRVWVYCLVAIVVLHVGARPGLAGIIVYTSQSVFEASINGLIEQEFSAAQEPDGSSAPVGNYVRAVYTNGSNATLSLTFCPQVTAVGTTLLSFTNNTGPRTFSVSLLGSFSATPQSFSTGPLPTSGSGTFLGFVGTGGEQIQQISFVPSIGANVGITSVEFQGTVSAVPAPAGLILAITGICPLGLVGWLRRRPHMCSTQKKPMLSERSHL